MKKLVSIVLTLVFLMTSVAVFATETTPVTVKFDGQVMTFDVEPVLENDRTMVPFRAIFEALGCAVFYSDYGDAPVVSAIRGESSLLLVIGEDQMYYNGEHVYLDAPAKIVNDRTLVPLRAISEAFGATVDWDEATNTALVYSKQGDYAISSKTLSKELFAEDGTKILDLIGTYPVVANPENDEFINTINEFNFQFVSDFLFADDELEAKAKALYEEYKEDFLPMELVSTFTVDTNQNGFLSFTHYTHTSMIENMAHANESIVWDMKEKKQLALEDILIGEREEHINQTVFDAFVDYYEKTYWESFDASVAEKLGEKLNQVHFYLTDYSLGLYFNGGEVLESYTVQKLEIPYSDSFFRITLDKGVYPLPVSVDINNLKDATVAVNLDEGGAYLNEDGALEFLVTVYEQELYDMADIANLKEGDILIRSEKPVKVTSIERTENGTVKINGGLEMGGYDLETDDNTVYYECGYNDSKTYRPLGIAFLPVSTEFIFTDNSDLDNQGATYYPGDFLLEDGGIMYHFTPHNTTLRIEDGKVVEMERRYIP